MRRDFDAAQARHDAAGSQPLKGLRIGVPAEYFGAGLAPDVAAAVEAALAQFEALGAVRVPVSLPRTELAIPAYYVIAPAEASSNLARYDGVRYGHRTADYKGLEEMIARSRAEGFGDEVKRRILIGTYVLSHGYYDAYYLQAQRLRRMIAQDFQRAYADQCDVIMGPVTPTVAKNIGDNRDDPTSDWLADVYTLGVSLAGLPAMSIPCGFGGAAGNRPVGLQIIGNYFDEGRLLAIADRYQQVTDWHKKRQHSRTPNMNWEIVIGLETHTQLSTDSKIFSGSSTRYGARRQHPGQRGRPGATGQPAGHEPRRRRARHPLRLAVGAEIAPRSVFARKNYFYPDLPKGYQISQYELPVVVGGSLSFFVGEEEKTVNLTRAHLEEDAGKSLHDAFLLANGAPPAASI